MNKITSSIDRISMVIVVIVPIFAILDIFVEKGGLIRNAFPFPHNLEVSYALVVTIAIGSIIYWLALLLLRLSAPKNNRLTSRDVILFIGTLVGIPMFCVFSVPALTLPEEITSFVQLGHDHFYTSRLGQFGDQKINYYFYKCNERDLECETLFHTSLGNLDDTPILVEDNKNQQIHFFMKSEYGYSRLYFTYGPLSHEYKMGNSAWIDETMFTLYSYKNNFDNVFLIIKCGKALSNTFSCDFLPFHFSSASYQKVDLVAGVNANEIKLLMDDRLVLSYDTSPHCHIEGCVITKQ